MFSMGLVSVSGEAKRTVARTPPRDFNEVHITEFRIGGKHDGVGRIAVQIVNPLTLNGSHV